MRKAKQTQVTGQQQRYQHYGWPVSYYSGKTRAYLHYKGIPFDDIAPSFRLMQGELKRRVGYTVMPVVVTPDDETLQDSSEIIDWFEAKYPEPSVYPDTPVQRILALLFELYGDEWLLLPAMHYRWNFPAENSEFLHREMGQAAFPKLPGFIQKKLASKITGRLAGYVKALGITENSIPAIEAWTATLCDQLDAHFAAHDYLFGGRPSIGDYGMIGPFWAHLGRDPWPKANLVGKRPHLAAWVQRMVTPPGEYGDWLPDDEIPATLWPIMQRFVKDYWPVLQSTASAVQQRLQTNPEQALPRGLGKAEFKLADITEQRVVQPFAIWMAQRPIDAYQQVPASQQAGADQRLAEMGLLEPLQTRLPTRLVRKNRRLFGAA